MARPDKEAAVAELSDNFASSTGVVLTEYRGLTVTQLKDLRRALGSDTTYSVVKNTLTKIAANRAGVDSVDDLLNGPTAIAFIKGDPVDAAKGLRDFAKDHPALIVKGGILDGKAVAPNEISRLADLESREVLLAKLAGAMKAGPQKAVSLFSAPLGQAARLLGALQAKREADGETAETAEQPAAEAPADAAPEAATETATEATEATEAPAEAATEDAASADA